MEKREGSLDNIENLEEQIENTSKKFLDLLKENNQEIQVISHFDTDGLTSATIMIQTLKKIGRNFSIKILKNLEKQFIYDLPKNKITIFLDLASGNLDDIKETGLENVFIIDHHEIPRESPKEISLINPDKDKKQKISSSCLTYLFCRKIGLKNKDLSKLAILGMIGDRLEKEIDKLNNGILEEGEIKRKRGLLVYPSTRPLNRVLEYTSSPYIQNVTGNSEGVLELLREIGLKPEGGSYKSLIELNKDEMKKLITAVMLRKPKASTENLVGDIFLIKLFNKLEDARELSAMVNACSRMGEPYLGIQFLMENPKAKKKAEAIHIRYKQHIISGLKYMSEIEKIKGKDFVILNAGNKIKDTIVGTLASILSSSSLYEEGTIIVTMSLNEEETKIKVSTRVVGRSGRNLREILANVIDSIGGEVGGHQFAAGCLINKEKESEFIDQLQKSLEIELVKL